MLGGSARLSARWRLGVGMGTVREKEATWPRAWTPASVRQRALGQDGLSGDAVDGLGESALDGWEGGLDLPTVEGGAVVSGG